MKKLAFYFSVLLIFFSCSTIKHVYDDELLLIDNIVTIDSVKTSNEKISELLLQKPNAKALGIPVSLYFYNLGNPKGPEEIITWKKKHPKWYKTVKTLFSEKQSIAVAKSSIGLNNWFIKNGEPPVIISDKKTKNTEKNLKNYFFTEGYFRNKVTYTIDTISPKKGNVNYVIEKGKPSILDTITVEISSPVLDSIYQSKAEKSFLRQGDRYKNKNFIREANRIVNLYRNNGIYHFTENNILFNNDTLNNYKKTKVDIVVSDRLLEQNGSYSTKPFEIQKIKNINVYTDYSYKNRNTPYLDTVSYNGIKYYYRNKQKYNPKYLSQSVFIQPGQLYTDEFRDLTRTHLRALKNFKSTAIRYKELNDNELEANIFLTPTEKYTLGIDTELSRSNIKAFDVSAQLSITNRNTFKGAELFKFSVSGSYFINSNNSNNNDLIGWEIGSNISLEVPRFMAPFGINKAVPKKMNPRTSFYTGISIQKNIGLDKRNITIGTDYNWNFNKQKSIQLELFNIQYIRNLNTENYFNIYNSEFNSLQEVDIEYENLTLPDDNNLAGIVSFMRSVASDANFASANPIEYQENLNILNRYNIVTSNFLIPEIAYNFTFNNQESVKDADFSYFRTRLANSGSILGLLSDETNANDKSTVLKLPIAQYFKLDFEYKKFWSVGQNSVLAHRTFLGGIITYNNSDIPFSRSYFAGGSNDIRAWQTYDLGPGTRPQGLEYNIGSLKFLSSFEYRFDLVGSLKSALFTDIGNIWDITNSTLVDDDSKFKGLKSLNDMAVAGGFGLRYDFKFLIARLDLGFKLREPYLTEKKWFKNPNINNTVLNLGINYPF